MLSSANLDYFKDGLYSESQYKISGTPNSILVYNPETIVTIEPQSLESKLNELMEAKYFTEAVKLLQQKPSKTSLLLKA